MANQYLKNQEELRFLDNAEGSSDEHYVVINAGY